MNDATGAFKACAGVFLGRQHDNIKGRVLDIGCGSKPYKDMFDFDEWVGLDMRPVGEVVADFHDLPFDDGEFDTVLLAEVLQLSPVPSRVVHEAVRVLKPGGHVLIAAPMCWPRTEGVFYTFQPAGLDFLLRQEGIAPSVVIVDGRLFTTEWNNLTNHVTYASPVPVSATSWCDSMDKRYPLMTAAVGMKAEQEPLGAIGMKESQDGSKDALPG